MSVSMRTKMILCGATGKTGNAVAHELAKRSDIELVALVAPSVATTPTRALPAGVPAFASLNEALLESSADTANSADTAANSDVVIVDFTHAEPARRHLELALSAKCSFVLGATGLDSDEVARFGARFEEANLALFQVPNFSLGAVLAMRVNTMLAEWFPDVEIIEAHHEHKRDSPSGTAVLTAQRIAQARATSGQVPLAPTVLAGEEPARGELVSGIPIHALRLPGATAHQEVVFGAPGELLTIRHDAIDRGCYAAGVALAARSIGGLKGLVTGLEAVL